MAYSARWLEYHLSRPVEAQEVLTGAFICLKVTAEANGIFGKIDTIRGIVPIRIGGIVATGTRTIVNRVLVI